MGKAILIILLSVVFISGCKKYYVNGTDLQTPDWTETTHGDEVPPDYAIVFDETAVNRFDIVIANTDWKKMQSDLHANVQTGDPPPAIDNLWTPVYVPCSFHFKGREWYKVGIRYTGNTGLQYCLNYGIRKYSFKLNFDHFEDQYVPIKNQRFYGFKELSLNDNFGDPSEMREKTAVDLFRAFGVKAPRAVFCEVWINYGSGPQYFGLYTLEEEVDNTVIKSQFADGGNLYKPDGTAATFANGTFDTAQFYKKTNLEHADFSDIRSLYDLINSEARIINYTAWKNSLESAFDVQIFLKWLAANTVMQDWDTYGKKHHNFYLYNNPENNKLTWIPWDNSEAFKTTGEKAPLSLSLDEVTEGWPLIKYLIGENEYKTSYRSYLGSFIVAPFSVESLNAKIENQADLIREFVNQETPGFSFHASSDDFEQDIVFLKQHVQNRSDSVGSFLSK